MRKVTDDQNFTVFIKKVGADRTVKAIISVVGCQFWAHIFLMVLSRDDKFVGTWGRNCHCFYVTKIGENLLTESLSISGVLLFPRLILY